MSRLVLLDSLETQTLIRVLHAIRLVLLAPEHLHQPALLAMTAHSSLGPMIPLREPVSKHATQATTLALTTRIA